MQMLTMDEVAAKLGVCRRTAENLLAAGRLPRPVRFGRSRRWADTQIEDFILRETEKAGGYEPPPPAAHRGRPRNP